MKNTAAIALLVARAAADEVGTGRADMKADHDRVVPGTVFQAATDEDGACVDDGVTTAKGELETATEEWQLEVDKVDGNATLAPPVTGTKAAIATAAGEMANAIGAVNTMNPVPANTDGSLTEPDATPTAGGQKELILADVAADLLSLTTRLTSNEALALQTSSKLTLDAKQALWNDANSANTLALGVQTKAGDAVTEATKHLAQTGADKTAAITDMNTAMVAWKGTSGAGASGAVDAGKTSWATEAADQTTNPAVSGSDSATKKQAYAWNDLTVAVGSCTADATLIAATAGASPTYTTCSSTATATAGGTTPSLVRLALRQKLIAENIVKRTTEKTAMLTAFCLANVALGSPKLTIEAGEEYYERADPGVRSDFAFIAATAVIGNEVDGTTKDSFQTLGTIEVSTAQVPSSLVSDQRKSVLQCTAGDSYSGTTGNVGDASIAAKPYDLLQAAVTAGVTASPASTYATWKGLADAAMTAYALMIATDTGYAEEQKGAAANGCDVLATPVIVLTVYTAAKQAAVTDGLTHTVALRPSNLVEDMTTPTDEPTLVTACKDACNKLPSFGLTVTGSTTTLTPTSIKEVCQGVQVPVAWDTNLATSAPKCKFISSAAIGTPAAAPDSYAAITANAATADATNACHKRRMDNGKLWYDAMVVTNSGAKTGEYALDNITAAASGIDAAGAYQLYLTAVDTWITARQLVMDKYTLYLHAKYVVQELGAATLKSEDNKLRAVARLSGTSTTTNNNIKQAYKAAWELAFYTTADVAAAVWAAAPQDADLVTDYAQLVQTAAFAGTPDEAQNMANLATLGYTTIAGHQDGARTDLHAKWLASKVVSGEKQALYDTQKAAYDSTVLAVDAQTALKAQAETDKQAADLVVTNADANTPTGTSEALATALTNLSSAPLVTWLDYELLDAAGLSALTTPQKTSANGVYNIARADYNAKLVLATSAKSAVDLLQANVAGTGALSATMLAYQSLAALRATAAGKVTATTDAIEDNRVAVVALDAKLVIKNAKAMLHRKALTTCMNTKYDNYKTTMNAAIQSKITDLKDIKSLLDGAAKPAPGATNARCEKGLSQGNGRASRAAPCADAANCCGAAKGPVVAAATWADAPTMTIELCMPIATKTYSYVPPRAPMATTAPASTQSWPFACIAGASKLAAAATALATTAYMMA